MAQPVQVFLFGHELSAESRQFVLGLDPKAKIFKLAFHVTRFDRVLIEVRETIDKLKKAGADTSNYTRTLIVPSGSSVASLVFAAAWEGVTGDLPEVLNLINRGPARGHVPSPEMPVLQLPNFSEKLQEDTEEPDLISLSSLKARMRQERRLRHTPNQAITVSFLGGME
jgi:hypothetical protein